MSKRRSSAQDDRFRSVPFFLLGTQELSNVSKNTSCLLWPRPPPIWTESDQNVTKDDRVIFARLFFSHRQFLLATSAKFSTKNIFKNTTCPRWPLYIGPQGGRHRQVWLYLFYVCYRVLLKEKKLWIYIYIELFNHITYPA